MPFVNAENRFFDTTYSPAPQGHSGSPTRTTPQPKRWIRAKTVLGYGYDRAAQHATTGAGPWMVSVTAPVGQELVPTSTHRDGLRDSATVVAAETGARGLSPLGGVIEETGANAAGGRIFTSTGPIAQNDFAGIVNSGLARGDEVHVLTGAHGAVDR